MPNVSLDNAFVWEKLRKAGAKLMWGSDWPVVEPQVVSAIQWLVNGRVALGNQEDQRQTLEEALEGYGHRAAYPEFGEDVKGFIAPKAIADFVLLSAKTKEGILDESTKVMLTVCNGKITYRDESL